MADKDFGIKRINLISSSGTPKITSPTTLNLDAPTVAISTDATIGGKIQSDVIVGTGYSVGIGSTQPQQALDVTGNINLTGVITATTFDGPLKGLPQNAQTSAYVLVASDAGKNVAITTGGVTVNTGVFDVGDTVSIYNDSEYTQMITAGGGVTLRRVSVGDLGDRGLNQYGLATIMCIRNNEFVISGAGLT